MAVQIKVKVSHVCIFKELGDTANPYSQKINPGVLILDPQNLQYKKRKKEKKTEKKLGQGHFTAYIIIQSETGMA